jgi:hypothetical protein
MFIAVDVNLMRSCSKHVMAGVKIVPKDVVRVMPLEAADRLISAAA